MFKNVKVTNLEADLVPVAGRNHQLKTVSTSVIQLDPLHANTSHVLVTVDTNNVRVTFDGQNPSTSDGHLLTAPYAAMWSRRRAQAAKFIRVSADATLVAQEMTVG